MPFRYTESMNNPANDPARPMPRRLLSQLANGVLIYAIFHGLLWLLAVKGGVSLHGEGGPRDGTPDPFRATVLPFAASALAAFLAHAGLRLILRRLGLRLSTSEASASLAFLGVLAVLALSGMPGGLFEAPDNSLQTPLALIAGAWLGVMVRRRIAL